MSTFLRRLWHQLRFHRIRTYFAIRATGSGYRDRCSCSADWAVFA